ncbi:hypothetical protein P153DRAFT_307949 [Dothidotthia symphoricarpi CBS 119687]|uniref:DUF7053 domain-containing protein n=1 Tax=Dothidotthia symphoricarpi CBS 119687 TaxID=1392245 RepID=A0A6A6ARY3_9PLEO|nr:uncharacterized protein P153DRAFT_307949 [Dothidotthia symphoricarpi CBS 119687]KAF2133281.1 hypothetical protein P153DRAFT_307949 [Dothidotthia symphoricarpi CBS 119687]
MQDWRRPKYYRSQLRPRRKAHQLLTTFAILLQQPHTHTITPWKPQASTPAKMMRRKTAYTNITPIPSFIPRQLAIDILHSHGEVIELNPLVTGHNAIKAPRDAPSDEFYSTWYEISQRIQYIPGMGKYGSGAIKFKGVFHDMPWGLQTHIYAPAGVDLRNKWQICGNQPGEPPQTHEMGIGAPPEGLYLREDIEIKCNMTMVSFVKKETKAASKILVERLIRKAELLDSGILHGMMQGGKLKTVNPADRRSMQSQVSPQTSPRLTYHLPPSPMSPNHPGAAFPQQPGQHVAPDQLLGQNNVVMELPGDFYHPQSSPGLLHPSDHRRSTSTASTSAPSPHLPDARWSQSANDNRSSISSLAPSEGPDQKAFTAELPTMEETREEYDDRQKRESGDRQKIQKYAYNPQDYAKMQLQQQQVHQQQQFAQPPQYSAYHPPGR